MKQQAHELIGQYDLNVKKIQYNRSHYYIETAQAAYLLRKVNIPKEQVAFEYEATTKLLNKGFQHLEKLYLTKKQSPYAVQQDKMYVLQAYRDLDEIDFRDKEDLKQAIKVLAAFHLAAKEIDFPTKHIEKVPMKNINDYFTKRAIECKKMKNQTANLSQKSKFEILFNENYNDYAKLQQAAIALMDKRISQQLIDTARQYRTLVHNEYTYHAVGKTTNGKYMIRQLDTCGYNIQVLDVANILTKVMQKNNWDIQLLAELIQTYRSINPLSEIEYQALKALLIFPEKFTSICHKYSNSKRRNNYTMFEMKWENMLEYKEKQLRVADAIRKEL